MMYHQPGCPQQLTSAAVVVVAVVAAAAAAVVVAAPAVQGWLPAKQQQLPEAAQLLVSVGLR